MPDSEKVINDLKAIRAFFASRAIGEEDEIIREAFVDSQSIIADAIALLQEQEAVEPFHRCIGKDFSLIEDSHFDYCPYCGKPITWAKQEGR